MSDANYQMLVEIGGIMDGAVPREGICTTANGVRWLCDRVQELKNELYKTKRELAEAREKIKRQAERICQLEGATNHAGGTPLSIALRERDEARHKLSSIHRWIDRNHPDGFIDSLTHLQNLDRVIDNWYDRLDRLEVDACRFERERDEARGQVEELTAVIKGLRAIMRQEAAK